VKSNPLFASLEKPVSFGAKHHEADISAECTEAQEQAWIPCAYEIERRKKSSCAAPEEGALEAHRQRREVAFEQRSQKSAPHS